MDTILNSAKEVLGAATVSVVDSARFIRNVLDAKPNDCKLSDAQFVLKVIEVTAQRSGKGNVSYRRVRSIFKDQAAFASRFDTGHSLYWEPSFEDKARTWRTQFFGA